MTILEKIRRSMRIVHTQLDEDILDDIEACKKDLQNAGVIIIKDNDPLILQAMKLYCKRNCNYQGLGEQYGRSYASLKDSLALSGEYRKGGANA